MNTFVTIKPIARFTKTPLKIYTVLIEEDGQERAAWEFNDWVLRHRTNDEVQNEYKEIRVWLETLSRGRHDPRRILRFEGEAHALPPVARVQRITFKKDLRLYCMVIGSKTIILFNGAVKTARTAQECPVVNRYFREANRWAKGIHEALKSDECEWNPNTGEIIQNHEIILP